MDKFLKKNGEEKVPLTLTTTGTSGAATLTSGVLNIPNYNTGGGSTQVINGENLIYEEILNVTPSDVFQVNDNDFIVIDTVNNLATGRTFDETSTTAIPTIGSVSILPMPTLPRVFANDTALYTVSEEGGTLMPAIQKTTSLGVSSYTVTTSSTFTGYDLLTIVDWDRKNNVFFFAIGDSSGTNPEKLYKHDCSTDTFTLIYDPSIHTTVISASFFNSSSTFHFWRNASSEGIVYNSSGGSFDVLRTDGTGTSFSFKPTNTPLQFGVTDGNDVSAYYSIFGQGIYKFIDGTTDELVISGNGVLPGAFFIGNNKVYNNGTIGEIGSKKYYYTNTNPAVSIPVFGVKNLNFKSYIFGNIPGNNVFKIST